MLYDIGLEQQREKLKEVIEYLGYSGISQKDIADRTGISTYDISHYKKGVVKNIPDEFLDNLHDEFNINPDYIRKASPFILDIPNLKFNSFKDFVDDWDFVYDDNDAKYLYLTMDRNFYDFLIESKVLKNNALSENYVSTFNALKERYSNKKSISEEFVIIPRNNFIEIVNDSINKQKHINEVLDMFDILSSNCDIKTADLKGEKNHGKKY